MREPKIRIAQLRAQLDVFGKLDDADSIFERIDAEILNGIVNEPSINRAPLAWDLSMSGAAWESLGTERCSELARQSIRDAFDRPYLRLVVSAVTGALGRLTPRAVRAVAPRAMMSVFKDCGDLTHGDEGERFFELVWTEVPVEVFDCPGYLDGFAVSMEEFFRLCGVKGDIGQRSQRAALRVTFTFRW